MLGGDAWPVRHRQNVVGNLAPTLVLCRQHIGVLCGFTFHLANDGKDVLLFQHALVIVLAESAEQLRGLAQRSRIDRSGRLADLVRELRIHKQGPPDHAMLAHQVFGRGHLRL
jgi:hypothetical protein